MKHVYIAAGDPLKGLLKYMRNTIPFEYKAIYSKEVFEGLKIFVEVEHAGETYVVWEYFQRDKFHVIASNGGNAIPAVFIQQFISKICCDLVQLMIKGKVAGDQK